MDSEPESLGDGDYFEKSSIVGDLRQRRILAILLDRSRPMTAREISVQIAARETDVEPADVTEEGSRSIRMDLHHRCLPKLEPVGWIERRPNGVVAEEPLPLGVEKLSLPELREPEHPFWDAVSVLLAQPRRRELVSVIANQRHRVTLDELATGLRTRGRPSRRGWPDDERDLLCTLHHVDLPKLAETGLIEYDADGKTIARTRRLAAFVDRMDIE
ncbi:DUF7344 domain-containing protein [Salinirarus marinus]|uniref:DUF7344 domain-containing protein n=1 Tax=Salinirarus marinus TaxID=3068310 RepID=UPI003C6C0D4D